MCLSWLKTLWATLWISCTNIPEMLPECPVWLVSWNIDEWLIPPFLELPEISQNIGQALSPTSHQEVSFKENAELFCGEAQRKSAWEKPTEPVLTAIELDRHCCPRTHPVLGLTQLPRAQLQTAESWKQLGISFQPNFPPSTAFLLGQHLSEALVPSRAIFQES